MQDLSSSLGVLGGSCDGDRISCIALCEVPNLDESPRASGLLYPTVHGGAFLQEQEPVAILAEPSNRGAGFCVV